MSIEVKHVTKRFGKTTALDDVCLTLGGERIYGLLGSNGAGKSTLLNVITNRMFPCAGSVLIDGASSADNDAALGKLYLMSEGLLYPDDMRVRKAIATAAGFYPDFDTTLALNLAEQFGLQLNKKVSALSTGYASICKLVLALAANTPYLLLDEPVLGLDAQHRDLFYRRLLACYAEKPRTVVISTHLIQEVAALVEHTVMIHGGRILRDQSTESLLEGAYQVSGPARLVDEYLAGRKTVSEQALGGLKTACLEGEPGALPDGLELGRVQLQDYFIHLMNREDAQ